MALYLSMDGVDDYLLVPSFTIDKIVLDFKPRNNNSTWLVYRSGYELRRSSSGNISFSGFSLKVNGVSVADGTNSIPNGTRATAELTNVGANSTIYLFSQSAGSGFAAGDLYSAKFYLGATLQAHYDMTTGTVQDQSGNGRHATLNGGNWLDDGTGGGAGTNASVTSVVAGTSIDTVVPVITTQQQLAVSSVIAGATADTIVPVITTVSSVSTSVDITTATLSVDALNPGVSTSSQIVSPFGTVTADAVNPSVASSGNTAIVSVITNAISEAIIPELSIDSNLLGIAGTSTADALSPQVGSFTNISVNAVVVSATADGGTPSVDTIRNIGIQSAIADATADALASMVGSTASVQITAVILAADAVGIAPTILTTQDIRIDSVTSDLAVDAISPTIQTDAIISAFIADLRAMASTPIINKDAIPTYNEVIRIVLNISQKQTATVDITEIQAATLDITQRMQSELKM